MRPQYMPFNVSFPAYDGSGGCHPYQAVICLLYQYQFRFHVYVCVCVSALGVTRLSQRYKYHHVPTMRQSFVSSFAIVLHNQRQLLQCA